MFDTDQNELEAFSRTDTYKKKDAERSKLSVKMYSKVKKKTKIQQSLLLEIYPDKLISITKRL